MSILAQLVIAGLIFAAGAAGGIKWELGIVAQRDLEAQKVAREQLMREERRVDSAAVGNESDKKTLRSKFAPINKEVDRVAQTDFYAAGQPACFDDDGLRQLRAAIATRPASASQPEGAVPGSGRAHWWSKVADSAMGR